MFFNAELTLLFQTIPFIFPQFHQFRIIIPLFHQKHNILLISLKPNITFIGHGVEVVPCQGT